VGVSAVPLAAQCTGLTPLSAFGKPFATRAGRLSRPAPDPITPDTACGHHET
jgi:hypothetical protein